MTDNKNQHNTAYYVSNPSKISNVAKKQMLSDLVEKKKKAGKVLITIGTVFILLGLFVLILYLTRVFCKNDPYGWCGAVTFLLITFPSFIIGTILITVGRSNIKKSKKISEDDINMDKKNHKSVFGETFRWIVFAVSVTVAIISFFFIAMGPVAVGIFIGSLCFAILALLDR